MNKVTYFKLVKKVLTFSFLKEWVLDTEREHKNVNRSAKTAGSIIKGCLPKILTFICKFSKRTLNVFPTGRYISSAMVFSIRFSTSRYIISLPQTQTEPINSNIRKSQTVL